MAQVISDPVTAQRLREAVKTVKLVDTEGKVLGHFVPEAHRPPEPTICEEELDRREAAGGGRSLAEILADLEKRA